MGVGLHLKAVQKSAMSHMRGRKSVKFMFGYELLEPKPMPKDFLPIWWPKYPEGAPIRYVYRLIDGDGSMDVNFKMSKVVRKNPKG